MASELNKKWSVVPSTFILKDFTKEMYVAMGWVHFIIRDEGVMNKEAGKQGGRETEREGERKNEVRMIITTI